MPDADYNLGATGAAWDLVPGGGELALYEVALGHSPANMEAYLRWGASANSNRESEAVGQLIWTTNDSVDTTGSPAGFVLVGDSATAAGYMAVSDLSVCGL